jgi:hypothetical protein
LKASLTTGGTVDTIILRRHVEVNSFPSKAWVVVMVDLLLRYPFFSFAFLFLVVLP